jgi:hypothetical protein
MIRTQNRPFFSSLVPQGLGILNPDRALPAIPTHIHTIAHILPASQFVSRYGPDPTLQQFAPFPFQSQDITQSSQASLPISAANPHITQSTQPDVYNPYNPFQRTSLQRRLENASAKVRFETALLTPLPDQTPEELEIISAPLTLMEMNEMGGRFGEEPLEVSGGVAVTEEAVKLHVADLITQI